MKLRFWGGLVNDLVNKIISIHLISCLLVKDIRLINRDKHLLERLPNVLQTHLLLVEQRRIRRNECKRLFAGHTIYGLVTLRIRVYVKVVVTVVRVFHLE